MKLRTLDDNMTPLSPKTLAEWEQDKQKLIENLRFASSIDLLKTDAPLNAQVFGAVEYDCFVVEKVIFQSLPGFYVTGNLYRPKDTSKKYPAILNPHGHWTHGRFETKDLARVPQRCANLAMRGMVAFIYDMIGFNDATQVSHDMKGQFAPVNANRIVPEGVYAGILAEYDKWNVGRFSLQLNNSLKAVDFVASLPYVDANRIGCTGCSGGGTQTYFLTALDQRIRAAAPINMASTLMQGGCICENQAFLRTEYNNIDYTMTIAPRPLFLSGSDGDWTVHAQEVEFPAVEKVYRLYGAEEKFSHFYQSAPHCYNLPIRERVYDFFCRHFGLENPFPGEVDLEIDTEALKIGDLAQYVPCEGFIDSEEKLFVMLRGVLRQNLAKLSDAQREDLTRRVYDLEHEHPLDIPYYVKGDALKDEPRKVVLGSCPAAMDDCGVRYVHCYNRAEDAKRVNALVRLMQEYPGEVFTASGKTAALCELAAKIAGHEALELTDCDDSAVRIPGIALTR